MSASQEHNAPRGARLMAVVRWGLLIGMTALAAITMWREWGPGAAHVHADEARFYCPMHPQIRSEQPGECPICQMRLEPIPRERRTRVGAESDAGARQRVPIDASADDAPDASIGARPRTRTRSIPRTDAGVETGLDTTTTAAASLAPPPGLVEVMVPLERRQLSGIVTVAAMRASARTSLRAPGLVEIPEGAVAEVHARAPGYVERIAVAETGTRVRRGQTLAWVYSPEIYQAQQELLTATRWSARSPDVGATAATGADMARAARQRLSLLGLSSGDVNGVIGRGVPLRAVPLRSPRAGYVVRRAAVLGAYAMPETVLYEIADLSRVWVIASISEADLASARLATRVTFAPTGVTPSGAAIEARIALVEPRVDASTRTARVRLVVENPDRNLRPGQLGDVLFELGNPTATALLVPRDAVMDTGEHRYVFVEHGDGVFAPRAVRTGALVDDRWEVLDGIAEGERVVTRGAFLLDAESRLSAALAGAEEPR